MSMAIAKACRCGGTRIDGRCDRCKPRDEGHKWRHLYKSTQWLKARAGWLARHPLCVACEREGLATTANTVDHIEPHRGDLGLFWDATNWQSLCQRCHAVKSGAE